ncbi:MAG: GNAT family N-acetyltransferase [Gammaproteobacteria bacterium]
MTVIRRATSADRARIREVHLDAFPAEEAALVATLAAALLDDPTPPGTLTLVAEHGGRVVGAVSFSPVALEGAADWQGYILSPLGVRPACHRSGVGSELVRHGMRTLGAGGVDMLFVYGDPDYYGRFGFDAGTADGYEPPHALQYPFGWQALVLNARASTPASGHLSCVNALRNPALW